MYETISLFSVDNVKVKRGWDIPFFNYIKINLRDLEIAVHCIYYIFDVMLLCKKYF